MGFLEQLPDAVSVYEVAPRDGLQNEAATVPTTRKIRLIDALVASGLRRIEITSFVSPKWIPQLADADEVAQRRAAARRRRRSARSARTRAGSSARSPPGIAEIAVFISASETHNKKNVNKTIAETLAAFERRHPARASTRACACAATSRRSGAAPTRATSIPRAASAIARELLEHGCYQVSLGDTIGVGTPRADARILERCPRATSRASARAALARHARHRARERRSSGSSWASARSTRRSAGSAAARTRPAPPATSRPRTSSTCSQGMGVETGVDLDKLWEAGQGRRGDRRPRAPGQGPPGGRSLAVALAVPPALRAVGRRRRREDHGLVDATRAESL